MKKLKCWKKVDAYSGEQWNKGKGEKLQVDYGNRGYYVQKINPSGYGGKKIKDGFKKKSQALKFANKYMKKHNIC